MFGNEYQPSNVYDEYGRRRELRPSGLLFEGEKFRGGKTSHRRQVPETSRSG